MKNNFKASDWLPKKEASEKRAAQGSQLIDTGEAVEKAVQELEKAQLDITSGYGTWCRLGFSLAQLGEQGREYFHRISRFNEGYEPDTCDRQFTRCLLAGGKGIGIGTFFHYVGKAGIPLGFLREENFPEIGMEDDGTEDFIMEDELEEREAGPRERVKLPVFPEKLYSTLPGLLQRVVAPASSPEERDLLLLGSLACFSACLPNVFGIYDGKKIFSNLYLFVTAPPSAGKGRLNMCKNLVLPIHKAKRKEARLLHEDYEREMAEYNTSKNDAREKPVKPPEKMLFIPANNSATGLFQLLHENEGKGLIFETEGDTLTQTFRSEYGNYSDGFRKAYHHEAISYYRRTDKEYVSLEEPALSTVLSGTPRQVNSLIPNAENGLFSRFLFYYMNLKPFWKDVFAENEVKNMEEYFLALGEEFAVFHKKLIAEPAMEIVFSKSQQQEFNRYFSGVQHKYLNLQPEEYVATVRRLGLNCFRMAMIFSALRYQEDGATSEVRLCREEDFRNAMSMASALIRHSSHVFNRLPESKTILVRSNRKERFLENLPNQFNRKDFLEVAAKQGLAVRSADRYIAGFVKARMLHRDQTNLYFCIYRELDGNQEE